MNFEQLLESEINGIDSKITPLSESEATELCELFFFDDFDGDVDKDVRDALSGLFGFASVWELSDGQEEIKELIKTSYPEMDNEMKSLKKMIKSAKTKDDLTPVVSEGKQIVSKLKNLQKEAADSLPSKMAKEFIDAIGEAEKDFENFSKKAG